MIKLEAFTRDEPSRTITLQIAGDISNLPYCSNEGNACPLFTAIAELEQRLVLSEDIQSFASVLEDQGVQVERVEVPFSGVRVYCPNAVCTCIAVVKGEQL